MEANNLSGYLITPNQKLKIPNGSTTTPSKTNPSTNNNVGGSVYSGQCTWYVFDRRSQAVNQISTYWSDAKYWAGNAERWLYSRS